MRIETKARTPRWSLLALLVLAPAALLPGCKTDDNDRVISAQEFEAPKLDSMRVLANKRDILKAIFPSTLDSILLDQLARARPLGKLEDHLVIYETVSGAVVSLDNCEPCSDSTVAKTSVTMHWTQEGLETDLFDTWQVLALEPGLGFDTPGSEQEQGVQPIVLRGGPFAGWMLALETSSGSLLAFKKDDRFRRVSSNFVLNPEASPNFGSGNGLLTAVVVSDEQIRQQLDRSGVRISRIFELAPGKIVVLFTQVREVHLLELTLETRSIDFDLERDTDAPVDVLVPRGQFRTFPSIPGEPPEPFLDFQDIQDEVTQTATIDLDNFQPVYVPPPGVEFCDGDPLPEGGSALLFDAGSATFVAVREGSNGRGVPSEAVSPERLFSAIASPPPYFMSLGAYGPSCSDIFVFEELTNTLVDFDFRAAAEGQASESLKVTAESVDFLLRRDPSVLPGDDAIPSGEETILQASVDNIRESRIYFDQGRDQLISVHFPTGNVIVVANRRDFEDTTGRPLSNLTWIEALDAFSPTTPTGGGEVLRAFDSEATAFLEIKVSYRVLPVVDKENRTQE